MCALVRLCVADRSFAASVAARAEFDVLADGGALVLVSPPDDEHAATLVAQTNTVAAIRRRRTCRRYRAGSAL
jgi:hypothetical protein